jgi:ADP-heptose:LPS heptosyltransferase
MRFPWPNSESSAFHPQEVENPEVDAPPRSQTGGILVLLATRRLGDAILFLDSFRPILHAMRAEGNGGLILRTELRSIARLVPSGIDILWFDRKRFSWSPRYRRSFGAALRRRAPRLAIWGTGFSYRSAFRTLMRISRAPRQFGVHRARVNPVYERDTRSLPASCRMFTPDVDQSKTRHFFGTMNAYVQWLQAVLEISEADAGRHGAEDEFAPPASTERLAATLLGRAERAGPLVGLVPGAGKQAKRWPLGRFIEIARTQMEAGRRPVFLLGPVEAKMRQKIAQSVPAALFPLQDWRIPARMSYDPHLTIALARRMALIVTNDCGLAHLLAFADPPMLTLFGAASPARWAPRVTRLRVLSAHDFGEPVTASIPTYAVTGHIEAFFQEMAESAAMPRAAIRRMP